MKEARLSRPSFDGFAGVASGKSLLQIVVIMTDAAGLAVQANNMYMTLAERSMGGQTSVSNQVSERRDGSDMSNDLFAS